MRVVYPRFCCGLRELGGFHFGNGYKEVMEREIKMFVGDQKGRGTAIFATTSSKQVEAEEVLTKNGFNRMSSWIGRYGTPVTLWFRGP